MSQEKLLLVDAAALAFRSYYGFIKNPLVRKDGFCISALFGYCNTLISVIDMIKPTHILSALDLGKPTFRHKIYEKYKANRSPCPPDLLPQLRKLSEFSDALGFKGVGVEGYEADDVIGTLCTRAKAKGMEVVILSGDKDFMQLIQDGVTMLKPGKAEVYETIHSAKVKDVTGVRPDQIIDYLALMGDSSDNVPGAPGIGKVTAAKLLVEYNDIDKMIAEAPNMKVKKLCAKLLDNRELISLSRDLVTICTEVPGLPDLDELRFTGHKPEEFEPVLEEYELPRIARRLTMSNSREEAPAQEPLEKEISLSMKVIRDLETFEKALSYYKESQTRSLAIDISEDNLKISTLAFSWAEGKTAVIDLNEVVCANMGKSPESILKELTTLAGGFGSHDSKKILCAHKGNKKPLLVFDTAIEASILEPGLRDTSLKSLSLRKLHLVGSSSSESPENDEGIDLAERKNIRLAQEADMTLRLHRFQKKELIGKSLIQVAEDLEIPLIPIIASMEQRGIRLDSEKLLQSSAEAKIEIEKLRLEVYELSGSEFNLNSTQQLAEVLFEKMKIHELQGLKKIKKTKTGYSTDGSVLDSLLPHPIATALLRYRFLTKLRSTYYEALPKQLNPNTGHVHTHYAQNGTATGRLSSQNPNLQNIPMRSEDGAKIRESFLPAENCVLISADYSQIELRVLAHFCQDELLIKAFEENRDIHTEVAAKIANVSSDQVSREQRSRAKAVNFGLIYGMGAKKLSQDTGLSTSEAKEFILEYFAQFPKIKDFIRSHVEKSRESGMCKTIAGRIRPLPDIQSSNGMRKSASENMAVNTPIQGSAADLIKWAMIRLDKKIKERDLPLDMLLQVHDELVFECPSNRVDESLELIRSTMEDTQSIPVSFNIPLKVEIAVGKNWLEAHS